MWIARLTATFPHIHSPAKSQTFFYLSFKVKTIRSDSNLDWNGLTDDCWQSPSREVCSASHTCQRELHLRFELANHFGCLTRQL